MTSRNSHLVLMAAAVVMHLPVAALLAGTAIPQGNPDLTQGGTVPTTSNLDWMLGATGARGWMHSEKLVTTQARQIAITAVTTGSPADGVLAVGDVILGIKGGRLL